MVRILSLLRNPQLPLNKAKKADLQYDRSIFALARKVGFGTAVLSVVGFFYARRVSSYSYGALSIGALAVSVFGIRRINAIIQNIDNASGPKGGGPRKRQGDQIRHLSQNFNGSKSTTSARSSSAPTIEERSIEVEEARKKVAKQMGRSLTSLNATEGAMNEQVKQEKLAEFVEIYDKLGASEDALYALRDLMNSDIDFALQEFQRRREKKESTPSAGLLLECLIGYKTSEEDLSSHGFNKNGIYGVLSLLSHTQQLPTTPEVFHALCMILTDSKYRETFCDRSLRLIDWLLKDDRYTLDHFKKLVSIEIKAELERHGNQLEAPSRTFVVIYDHFQARPELVSALLADGNGLITCQYLAAWIFATERPVSHDRGSHSKPYICDAHEEFRSLSSGQQPIQFLNRYLVQEKFKQQIQHLPEHFRVNAAYHLLIAYLSSQGQNRLPLAHLRTLRTMLYVLEGAEHLEGNSAVRIKALFTGVLNQAESNGSIVTVFSYLLDKFWCFRDNKRELDGRAPFIPIRNFFIEFFKQSDRLKAWYKELPQTDNLHMYLKKLLLK